MRHEWYALHTFTGHEKKVKAMILRLAEADGLADEFTEIYVPEEEEVSSVGGKKRIIKRKLYPGYVFVKFAITDATRDVVRRAAGQNTFAAGDPPPLSDDEVRDLLRIREQPEEVQTSAYGEGEIVRIVAGPFAEFTGRIVEVNLQRESVKVMINIFGRDTPVELKFTEVEREE